MKGTVTVILRSQEACSILVLFLVIIPVYHRFIIKKNTVKRYDGVLAQRAWVSCGVSRNADQSHRLFE